MEIRQVFLFDQEVLADGARVQPVPTRRVAACAVLRNPLAGRPYADDLSELVDISVRAGELLTARALGALGPLKPRGYEIGRAHV